MGAESDFVWSTIARRTKSAIYGNGNAYALKVEDIS